MILKEGHMISGRYYIQEKIGAGGMSVVYRATDTKLDRSVTVKVLRDELNEDELFREKLKEEARAVAKLNHPNIVNIYDEGQEGDISYIVVEYVDGQTLKEIIGKAAPLENGQIIIISSQIATALAHAHAHKIIHRDIKPQNIMIGTAGSVKVTDFGLARVAAPNGDTINAKSVTMGSVHYLSPEQARGGFVDERSDLYSLGIVMFEMATGKLPFDGDKNVTVALKHINTQIPDIRALNPNTSPALESIIAKLTAKTTVERYQNAKELLVDLKIAMSKPGDAISSNVSRDSHTKTISKSEREAIRNGAVSSSVPVDDNDDDTEETEKSDQKRVAVDRLMFVGAILTSLVLIAGVLAFALPRILPMIKEEDPPAATDGAVSMYVSVPDLIGLSFEDAAKACEERGLALLEQAKEASDKTIGTVIWQNYKQGDSVNEGATISVVVSAGGLTFLVQDFVGQSEDDIMAHDYTGATFNIEVQYEKGDAPYGNVLRQEPAAGETAKAGTTIVLYVSEGDMVITPEGIVVPTVTGGVQGDAEAALEDFGLKLGSVTSQFSDSPKGIVIAQVPRAGARVQEGTAVDIVVSGGAEPITPSPEPTSTPTPSDGTETASPSPAPAESATDEPTETEEPNEPIETDEPIETEAPEETVPPIVISSRGTIHIQNTLSPDLYEGDDVLVRVTDGDTGTYVLNEYRSVADFPFSITVWGSGTVSYDVTIDGYYVTTITYVFD